MIEMGDAGTAGMGIDQLEGGELHEVTATQSGDGAWRLMSSRGTACLAVAQRTG